MLIVTSACGKVITYCEPVFGQILLEYEDFDEALNMLDQVSSEGNQLDVLLYNTILQKACEKVLFLRFPVSPSISHTHI